MIQQSMVLQEYTPQIHLGDWQLLVLVNRRRNRLTVERCHSSEEAGYPLETPGAEYLRIDTGIRAFRRQMPVVASALEKIDPTAMTDAQIVEAVFQALIRLYAGKADQDASREVEFLEERRLEALDALTAVSH